MTPVASCPRGAATGQRGAADRKVENLKARSVAGATVMLLLLRSSLERRAIALSIRSEALADEVARLSRSAAAAHAVAREAAASQAAATEAMAEELAKVSLLLAKKDEVPPEPRWPRLRRFGGKLHLFWVAVLASVVYTGYLLVRVLADLSSTDADETTWSLIRLIVMAGAIGLFLRGWGELTGKQDKNAAANYKAVGYFFGSFAFVFTASFGLFRALQ